MKTILVATDFSEPANNAVAYAALLSKQMRATLILLNVFKPSIHASNSFATSKSIDEKMRVNENHLMELATEIALEHSITVKWELDKDDIIASLKNYVAVHSVDLVIMGIESNLTEYKLFGNTTTAAIRLMQFPLLVVPHNISFTGIHTIMYACESSYLKEDCKLTVLKDFIRAVTAKLTIFHVLMNQPNEIKNEALESIMNEKLSDLRPVYRYGHNAKVGEGIEAGLALYPADLLVMIPHKLGFFEALIKGSQTSQMTVKTRVPLLVIPNEKACYNC